MVRSSARHGRQWLSQRAHCVAGSSQGRRHVGCLGCECPCSTWKGQPKQELQVALTGEEGAKDGAKKALQKLRDATAKARNASNAHVVAEADR
jgi:hypothetical protein